VLAPFEASKMKVVDTLNGLGYERSDWRLWLGADELLQRAEALLAVELSAGALTTLAAVAESERGFDWQLLDARALIAAGRGAEALARLAAIEAPDAAGRTGLDWLRAEAAAEAARSRRGRTVAAAETERLRRLERELLLAVARSDADGDLVARALARLGAGYLDDGRATEAIAAYRQLAALRPADRSGARPLFERGWGDFVAGAPARAITLWHELAELYPNAPSTRSARYWTARALEQTGQREPARALYLQLLAADTADFYARQAALRLAGAEATLAAPAEDRQAWPVDRRLARVQRLTDVGLDGLARTELELVGDAAEPRARAALAAVVLARSGERRASLSELRRAFPELGTAHQRHLPQAALELYYPTDFRTEISRAAALERVDPYVLYAMIHQESAFDPKAQSRSGARGLMQLMPATGQEVARRLGLPFSSARLYDPDYSVRLGSRYFLQMLGQFDDRVELALASYNGGPGRISRLWRAAGPEPELDRFLEGLALAESRNYVKRILVLADSYRSLYPGLG
jgi:soluble lytic murein transglycosylase